MSFKIWVRIALGYLVIVSAQIGVWALVAPRSFYDGFPGLGRSWVSVDGPYNEHLVRDVGALNLAITVLFVITIVRSSRELITVSGIVALAWGLPHAVYHAFNTDVLEAGDAAASLAGLVTFAVIGGGLIYAASHAAAEQVTS